jgi:hypothetical protein
MIKEIDNENIELVSGGVPFGALPLIVVYIGKEAEKLQETQGEVSL